MQKRYLKSTTSLVMSFALIAQPVLAQETATDAMTACVGLTEDGVFAENLDLETLTPTFPCQGPGDLIIADEDALRAAIDAQVAVAPDAEAVTEEQITEADEVVETEVDEGAEAVADVADDTAPSVEEVEQDLAETVEQTEDAVDEPVTAEAEVGVGAEADADVEADAVVEVPAETEAPAEPETQTAEGATNEALPEGDGAAVIADTPMVGDEVDAADVVTDETVKSEVDPVADETADTSIEAEVADGNVAVAEPVETEADVATDDTAPVEAETEVVVQEAEPEVPPAAAEVDIDALADAEAETVTEEDVRASDQDFDTAVIGEATAEATTSDDDDDGLTDFQQALLLGLGAVVVGSVLDNGDEVVSNSGDRVVVQREGELVVLKDDDVLLRQPGSQVQTQTFDDGSTLNVVTRADNTRIVTIRGADGRVMQRKRVFEDGSQVILFDDTQAAEPVNVATLPVQEAAPSVSMSDDADMLREILLANQQARFDRTYSLRQVRTIREVRQLAPEVELDTVTFATGSAAIDPSQAEELVGLGNAISDIIQDDPGQVFLIEGHTDAIGDAGYNLALSDRRAETVALALTEYFAVPPENLITQGYGESNLKIATLEAERQNRRAAVRNITQLLQ